MELRPRYPVSHSKMFPLIVLSPLPHRLISAHLSSMITPWTWARNLPLRLAISAVFSLALILGYIKWYSQPARLFSSKSTPLERILNDSSTSNISDIIQTLYEPLRLAPAEPLIQLPDGTPLELS